MGAPGLVDGDIDSIMGEGAISILSSLELDEVIDLTNGCIYFVQMIHHYRDLSETNLVTIRDLFRFMLALNSRSPTAINYPSGRNSAFASPIPYQEMFFESFHNTSSKEQPFWKGKISSCCQYG